MRVGFDQNVSQAALRSRLRRLPRKLDDVVNAGTRKHAHGYEMTLKTGVRKANFGLVPLKRATIRRKARRFRRVMTPLMAAGGLVNKNIRTVRTKRGWRVRPFGKHRRSGINAQQIWNWQAAGAGNLPARPAWDRALRRYYRQRIRIETNREMVRGIKQLLKGGAA